MQSDTLRHTEITSYRLDDLYRYCNELFAAQPGSGRGNLRTVVSELLNRLRQNLHFDYLSFTLHDSNLDIVYIVDSGAEAAVVTPDIMVPVRECPAGIAYLRGETQHFNQSDLEGIGTFIYAKAAGIGNSLHVLFPAHYPQP